MKSLTYFILGCLVGVITMLNLPVFASEKQSSSEKLCYALVAAKLLKSCSW